MILDFFTTWCGPCRDAFPHLRELLDRYGDAGLAVVGVTSIQGEHRTSAGERIVTMDDPEREYALMQEFRRDSDVRWPVVFTRESVSNVDYGVAGIPSLAILDRAGRVRAAALHPVRSADEIGRTLAALLPPGGRAPDPRNPAGGP